MFVLKSKFVFTGGAVKMYPSNITFWTWHWSHVYYSSDTDRPTNTSLRYMKFFSDVILQLLLMNID